MRKKFIGFYNPTTDEINNAWENGVFAFDANTLLNLYRYTDSTRKDFLSALKTIKNKLFLPYQAAYEYHNNRLDVIEWIEKAYEDLYDLFPDNFTKNLKNTIYQYKKHPTISIDKIERIHEDFLKNIQEELDKQKEKHPNFKTNDQILDELSDLFDDSVGEEFTEEDLKKIYKEGESRYANKIPPGYKDLSNKSKEGERHIYGDLIIWKELLNLTKTKKQPLIFITDDRKEDWWTIQKGKTIRPREELIKEFYDITGIRILIYNADNFLSYAKEKGLLPKLKEETIEEVKKVRVSEEKHYTDTLAILRAHNLTMQNDKDLLKTYQPIETHALWGTDSLAMQNTRDILRAQIYQPTDISTILKSQNLAMQNAEDVFNAYQPIDINTYLNEQTPMNHISDKKQKTNNDSKAKDKTQKDKNSK
jgi:hypothetical protein